MEKRIILLYVIVMTCILYITHSADAATTVNVSDGKLVFTTIDTKATTGTKWETVGFTVTMKKCLGSTGNGGYPTKYQHATIWLKDGSVVNKNMGNGTLKCTFTISETDFTKALIDAGFSSVLRDGGTIYLNGIFQVIKNGTKLGGTIDNLYGIKHAQPWKNPGDFDDRFDIAVVYNAAQQSITVKYVTENGTLLSSQVLDKAKWKRPGESFSYTFDTEKTFSDDSYTLVASYFSYNADNGCKNVYKSLDYGYSLAEIKKISSTMRLGGVTLYAVMSAQKNNLEVNDEENLLEFGNEQQLRKKAVIYAEEKGNEKYYVSDSIPGGENVYIDSSADRYLYKGSIIKESGSKQYKVTVRKTFILKWKEETIDLSGEAKTVNKSQKVSLSKDVLVTREYSYWKINNLAVYYLDNIDVKNSSIGRDAFVLVNQQKRGNCEYVVNSQSIVEPVYDNVITLPDEIIDGGNDKPATPTMDFRTPAEKAVGNIKVRNDKIVIGGKVIIDSGWSYTTTSNPVIPNYGDYSEVRLLYRNIAIPSYMGNGTYKSVGNANYKKIISYKMDAVYNSTIISKAINNINTINVLTPVLCDGQISSDVSACQLTSPDYNSAQLVLGQNFTVKLSNAGNHISKKGYYYQNYGKYTAKNQVKFPFDVYVGSEYCRADEWIDLKGETITCLLPIWVDEGEYSVVFRSIAINAYNDDAELGEFINAKQSQYGAQDSVQVVVSGRMYGFNVYDVSDYPLWQSVFRNGRNNVLTGINYSAGINDYNGTFTGRKSLFTLPFLDGSHPLVTNKGALKAGYTLRMSLYTIGNMYDNDDFIHIKPEFYFIDKSGNRTKVDLYYTETFYDDEGRKYINNLIKVGDNTDLLNIKKLSISDTMLGVDAKKINRTALLKGIDAKIYADSVNNLFTFGNIMINDKLQILRGIEEMNLAGVDIPDGVDEDKVEKSAQQWFFEYYLPADLHIAKEGSKPELNGYIDFTDDCWYKNGYLVLNFDITSLNGKEEHLSYENEYNSQLYGYCNMWDKEGMQKIKTDYSGNQFNIEYGDIAFFYINKSVSTDYTSGGTH